MTVTSAVARVTTPAFIVKKTTPHPHFNTLLLHDNQSRRNNLLFLGFEPARGGPESWQDCERKVKKVIHEEMGIAEEIHIERAHRAGKVIVARFLSYKQKMAVLSKAREPKNSDYDHIYVREDFSESVQTKRQALMKLQRELRQRGVKANLSFDKLIAGDSVYTYDMASNCTVRKARRSRQATWRRDDQFHEAGRSWDAQGDRDGHNGTTNDLWPTATPEHRPRSSPASSNYLLPTHLPPMSEFPPLQSGRDEIMDTSVDNEDVAEIRPLGNPNASATNANYRQYCQRQHHHRQQQHSHQRQPYHWHHRLQQYYHRYYR